MYDKKFEGFEKIKIPKFQFNETVEICDFLQKEFKKMRNKLDILISVNKAKKLLNKSLKNKKNYSETVETKASVNRIISKTVFSKKHS